MKISYSQLIQMSERALFSQDVAVTPANLRAAASRLRSRADVVGIYDDIFAAAQSGATLDDVMKSFDLMPQSEVKSMYEKARKDVGGAFPQPQVEDPPPIADDTPITANSSEEVADRMPTTQAERGIDQVMAERIIEHLARVRGATVAQLVDQTKIGEDAMNRTLSRLGSGGAIYRTESGTLALTTTARNLLEETMRDDKLDIRKASAVVREATTDPAGGEAVTPIPDRGVIDDEVQVATPGATPPEPDPAGGETVTPQPSVIDAVPVDPRGEPDPAGGEPIAEPKSVHDAVPNDTVTASSMEMKERQRLARMGLDDTQIEAAMKVAAGKE